MTKTVPDHLAAVTQHAAAIRKHLADLEPRADVHFRPSSTGVAMIGLRPERPQRGKSGYKNLVRLREHFDTEYLRHCVDIEQGRPTPEKRLQSYLLRHAYTDARRMNTLATPNMRFVTDELALPRGGGKRIICDMLLLRETRAGTVPVLMELKSARELTRLVAQVGEYARLVDGHRADFEALYTATLGEDVTFGGPAERWIVWPCATGTLDAEPREAELREAGIRVVSYVERGDDFAFRVRHTPMASSQHT